MNFGLKYDKSVDSNLTGFSDADWAGDIKDRHSTIQDICLSCLEELSAGLAGNNNCDTFNHRLLSDIKATPTSPTIIK